MTTENLDCLLVSIDLDQAIPDIERIIKNSIVRLHVEHSYASVRFLVRKGQNSPVWEMIYTAFLPCFDEFKKQHGADAVSWANLADTDAVPGSSIIARFLPSDWNVIPGKPCADCRPCLRVVLDRACDYIKEPDTDPERTVRARLDQARSHLRRCEQQQLLQFIIEQSPAIRAAWTQVWPQESPSFDFFRQRGGVIIEP